MRIKISEYKIKSNKGDGEITIKNVKVIIADTNDRKNIKGFKDVIDLNKSALELYFIKTIDMIKDEVFLSVYVEIELGDNEKVVLRYNFELKRFDLVSAKLVGEGLDFCFNYFRFSKRDIKNLVNLIISKKEDNTLTEYKSGNKNKFLKVHTGFLNRFSSDEVNDVRVLVNNKDSFNILFSDESMLNFRITKGVLEARIRIWTLNGNSNKKETNNSKWECEIFLKDYLKLEVDKNIECKWYDWENFIDNIWNLIDSYKINNEYSDNKVNVNEYKTKSKSEIIVSKCLDLTSDSSIEKFKEVETSEELIDGNICKRYLVEFKDQSEIAIVFTNESFNEFRYNLRIYSWNQFGTEKTNIISYKKLGELNRKIDKNFNLTEEDIRDFLKILNNKLKEWGWNK